MHMVRNEEGGAYEWKRLSLEVPGMFLECFRRERRGANAGRLSNCISEEYRR